MANLAIAPVVNAKLYRHFAAITIAVTLCVALFASGEARQVVNDEVSEQQQTVKLQEANAKKVGVKQIGDRRSRVGTRNGFGDDYDPSYGMGRNSAGSQPITHSSGYSDDIGIAAGGPASAKAPAVLSPDEVARLSAQEQSAYIKRLRNESSPPREEVVRDLASIEAGSRARSGSTASD